MAVDLGVDDDIAAIKALAGTDTTWWAKVAAVFRRAVHSDSNDFGPNALLDAVASATGIPVGGLLDFPATSVPTGFHACDGRSLSRTTYAALFAVVGTRFGSDGAGTFKVPDFRRRQAVGRGAGAEVGTQTGSETGVMAEANLPAHTHAVGSMTVAEAPAHGHQDEGAFGGGRNIFSNTESSAFLIMPSPELVRINTPNSNDENSTGRESLSADVSSQSGGAHTHGTSGGETETAGSSESVSVVGPSITMVKCIYAGQA